MAPGMLGRLFGRSEPPPPDLDALFAIPGAVLTLQASLDLRPTGLGSVSFREAEGAAAGQTVADVQALLDADQGPAVERTVDDFGYTWLLVRHEPDEVPGLVTDLHAVNTTLELNGFGGSLLCSLVGLRTRDDRSVALVYLYKRGTFYPFAPGPRGGRDRDTALELQVRGAVGADLPVEPELSRWFPVWGAPAT
jgi:hypothetical protein